MSADAAIPGSPIPMTLPSVSSVPEVLARLLAIQNYVETHEPLGANDGVACFNYLYRAVTQDLLDKIDSGFFADADFLNRLDVVFANRYLDALRAHQADPKTAPSSWEAMFEVRSDTEIAPMQFGVAGINAHINFDLPCAVVATCQQHNLPPDSGTQRADYDKINQVFALHMGDLRQHFEDRLARWLDKNLFDAVVNRLCDWSVDAARDTAWANANVLWALRENGVGEDDFVSSLDRLTGLAGRGLLAHV